MSRAFVREDRPDTEPLPDRPISPHPTRVTPRGLAALKARLAGTRAGLGRLRAREDRPDLLPGKAAGRDIRHLEARLASAIPVDPAAQPRGEVAFGAVVTVADGAGREAVRAIVGESEADAAGGLIAPHSPLARALTGARLGDTVDWRRPSGVDELELLAIAYPP